MVTKSVKIEYFGDTTKYERATKGMLRMNKKATRTMKDSWKAVGGAIAGVFAFRQSFRFFTESARLAGIQQKSLAGLEQVMRSMGRFSPEFFDSMVQNAEALQKVTLFGDEATIAGQKFLLSYREITNDLMPRATAAMLDFAAMMKGDVVGAANALGKASMGMTGELRRIGITIDPLIAKSGDFAAILGEIEKQIGGQARAIAETGIGPWEQLVNLWGDAREKIGELVLAITKGMIPALKGWIEGVDILARSLKNLMAGASPLDIMISNAEELRGKIQQIDELMSRKRSISENVLLSILAPTPESLAMMRQQLTILEQTIKTRGSGGALAGPAGGKPTLAPSPVTGDGKARFSLSAAVKAQIAIDEEMLAMATQNSNLLVENDIVMFQRKHELQKAAKEREREEDIAFNQELHELRLRSQEETVAAEIALRRNAEARIQSLKQRSASMQINIAKSLGTTLLQVAGTSSEAIFLVAKGFDIAVAIISAHAAGAKALAEVPYPYNLAVSAKMVTLGYLQAAAIAAVAIGQMAASRGGSGLSGGGTFVSPTVTAPATPPPPTNGQTGPTVILNIHGDFFDSMESRQALATWLTEYVEEFGGDLAASRTF